jgi:hypothetical protein
MIVGDWVNCARTERRRTGAPHVSLGVSPLRPRCGMPLPFQEMEPRSLDATFKMYACDERELGTARQDGAENAISARLSQDGGRAGLGVAQPAD